VHLGWCRFMIELICFAPKESRVLESPVTSLLPILANRNEENYKNATRSGEVERGPLGRHKPPRPVGWYQCNRLTDHVMPARGGHTSLRPLFRTCANCFWWRQSNFTTFWLTKKAFENLFTRREVLQVLEFYYFTHAVFAGPPNTSKNVISPFQLIIKCVDVIL
jgi:hypothetical protein